MSTYYGPRSEELTRTGMQPGEFAIYVGTVRDGLRSGPSTCDSKNAYAYWWPGEGVQELDACFQDKVLEVSILTDHYVFLRNQQKNFIQQVSGPTKPVVFGNIGAEAIRVNTPLGKFLVPAGTVLRLDRNAPLQREKKKVLLTFSNAAEHGRNCLESALMLDGRYWKPLNICGGDNLVEIRDGAFTIQTLTLSKDYGSEATLEDPPVDSDYELYLRSTAARYMVYLDGVGMQAEGLARTHYTFSLKQNEIYDFQRMRQAPTIRLMHQCTARLPGLEELDGRSGDGQGEEASANRTTLRELLDSWPDGADIPDIK